MRPQLMGDERTNQFDRNAMVREICGRHDDDTLTVDEVALWLNHSRGRVIEHASHRRRPHIPCVKDGKTFTFRWGTLKQWRLSLERRVKETSEK
jgi:hypothetical protein